MYFEMNDYELDYDALPKLHQFRKVDRDSLNILLDIQRDYAEKILEVLKPYGYADFQINFIEDRLGSFKKDYKLYLGDVEENFKVWTPESLKFTEGVRYFRFPRYRSDFYFNLGSNIGGGKLHMTAVPDVEYLSTYLFSNDKDTIHNSLIKDGVYDKIVKLVIDYWNSIFPYILARPDDPRELLVW